MGRVFGKEDVKQRMGDHVPEIRWNYELRVPD